MTFGEAIQTVLRKYAEFSGRASRPEFWWWALFAVLVTSALSLFNVITIGDKSSVGSILTGLWSIAILLPNLAVAVRRLRDAGYGWGHLFWVLVPVAGWVVLVAFLVQPTKVTAPAAPTTAPA
jgi:uncharacterized membrane protein YhaH (DUF805 family)